MFIAILFTAAKIWNQPNCPSIDTLIKKIWHIYSMEYYSSTKKEGNLTICDNMECIYLFKLVFSFSLGKYPVVEFLDHMVTSILIFWGTSMLCPLLLQAWCGNSVVSHCYFLNGTVYPSWFPILCQILVNSPIKPDNRVGNFFPWEPWLLDVFVSTSNLELVSFRYWENIRMM